MDSLGLDRNDLDSWISKWTAIKDNAKGKCEFSLTFNQYTQLAVEAGILEPSQIGVSIDSYQMGRIGDIGNYELGNCRFITKAQNLAEQKDNGGTSDQAMKMRCRTKLNHNSVAISADKNSKMFEVVSPGGITYTGKNLKQFCLDHGLNVGNFSRVCQGLAKQSKGWTGKYV